jgi:hypothetical protein
LIWSWKEREQFRRIRPDVTDGSGELFAGAIFIANPCDHHRQIT